MDPSKPTLAIIGTGWAGWTLTQELGKASCSYNKTHNIIVLSPHRTMALTPLLASAACSIFDLRIAEEPVRRLGLAPTVQKYQVEVKSVDLEAKTIRCIPAIGSNGDARTPSFNGIDAHAFDVSYDTLVLAPGSETNTFGTPGVLEHCYTMKSVKDAQKLRERMLDCFELASLPTCSGKQKRNLLHFAIVGGGPTGVELAAEIDELIHGHLSRLYHDLADFVTISVYDIADRLLGPFDEQLSEYAMQKFNRRSVNTRMGRHIESFEKGVMKIKEDGEVPFGICIWATGNKSSGLVENLGVRKSEGGMSRILTDQHLRVLQIPNKQQKENNERSSPIPDLYALGDAADILGSELPTTAEVAVQKAKWLAKHLLATSKTSEFANSVVEQSDGFHYDQKPQVAYIGRHDGVVEGQRSWTGKSAWLAWRSGNLNWTRSWRRRTMIWVYWGLNYLDGREVARR
jgi:NADH:ubiquinone reductase (non-electrogenic)